MADTLVAPPHVVDGPHGSVMVDPSKVVTPEPKSDRPAWLPEKFKTAEDMAKAYGELETKLGKPADAPEPTLADAKAKGIDVDALSREYAEKGELSAESLASLEKAGFTKAHVKTYVDGITAKQAATRGEFAELAGGEEGLAAVLDWAKTGLSPEEAAGYDALVESGNVAAAKMVFQGIVARYTAENGDAPKLIDAETVPGIKGVKPFESQMQVVEAMNDKRYKTDEAYRNKVIERLYVSNL